MTRREVRTGAAAAPVGTCSQGIVAGGFLFTSGCTPHAPGSRRVAPTVSGQTRQALENIRAILAEHDLTLDDVVRCTVYLQHINQDFAEFDAAFAELFTPPGPARTTVGSDLLDVLVTVDAVAPLR
ncbi:RidA family protein [Lipingzhangella sp. LS1_29]|uniref:RidA family protein n=1 Tax=Lipingzhangella rawalii TaxID=2055835 RepID=A0ABU2H463_9ACTN|nr:RidA family protein [Lipingzhangella rawalii]MDS1270097.1 RidA family protein [Lipingzhangella rawalii]